MKYLKILILLLVFLLGIIAVSAHGVDVTADTMVIANETNGQLVKDIADANGKNISVYKFSSADEVKHILEELFGMPRNLNFPDLLENITVLANDLGLV